MLEPELSRPLPFTHLVGFAKGHVERLGHGGRFSPRVEHRVLESQVTEPLFVINVGLNVFDTRYASVQQGAYQGFVKLDLPEFYREAPGNDEPLGNFIIVPVPGQILLNVDAACFDVGLGYVELLEAIRDDRYDFAAAAGRDVVEFDSLPIVTVA